MQKLTQFGIILSVLLAGEIVQAYYKLPIPSTVVGMVILLLLLIFKIVKLEWIESASNSLLDNLSFMFIPSGVALMKELHIFQNNLLAISLIILSTTVLVMLVTGYTVQTLIATKRR